MLGIFLFIIGLCAVLRNSDEKILLNIQSWVYILSFMSSSTSLNCKKIIHVFFVLIHLPFVLFLA